MSKKDKPTKDKSIKTFSITQGMMADLMFFLRPMKERQQEALFWQKQLQETQDDIVRSQGIDPTKFSVDWMGAYKTGKLVCTKLPEEKHEPDKSDVSK